MVIRKLNRMEGKLDRVLAETARVRGLVDRLHVKVDALPMAVLSARLEEVSMARLYDEPRRRDSLRDSVERLAELRHFYGALLASSEFCAFGTDNLQLSSFLADRDVSVPHYLQLIEEQEQTGEPLVIIDARK